MVILFRQAGMVMAALLIGASLLALPSLTVAAESSATVQSAAHQTLTKTPASKKAKAVKKTAPVKPATPSSSTQPEAVGTEQPPLVKAQTLCGPALEDAHYRMAIQYLIGRQPDAQVMRSTAKRVGECADGQIPGTYFEVRRNGRFFGTIQVDGVSQAVTYFPLAAAAANATVGSSPQLVAMTPIQPTAMIPVKGAAAAPPAPVELRVVKSKPFQSLQVTPPKQVELAPVAVQPSPAEAQPSVPIAIPSVPVEDRQASPPPIAPSPVAVQPFNVGGTVQSADAGARSLTMEVQQGGRTIREFGTVITVQVPAEAKIVMRSQSASFEVIQPGAGVTVVGEQRDQTLTAKSVVVRPGKGAPKASGQQSQTGAPQSTENAAVPVEETSFLQKMLLMLRW